MTRLRTLLVGLDAAGWEFINPLLERGELPALQNLMANGRWGTLASTMPALTPAAWSSIITGKNPGKHGIFDMTRRRPGRYDFAPVSAAARQGTPFWQRLNEAGIRVGLVNIPFTYPPDEVDGFVVCGFGAPGSVPNLAYPPAAMTWINKRSPDFEPAVLAELLRSGDHERIFAVETAHQSRFVEIALGLAERTPVDVLAINLMLLDHANHKMPDMARIERAIRRLDDDLAQLIDGFVPDVVLAISDHGSRRVKGDFLLHAWLRDEGCLVQAKRPSTEQAEALNWILHQWLAEARGLTGVIEKLSRRFWRGVVPRLPADLADKFWARVEAAIPFARDEVMFGDKLDVAQTRIYPGAAYSGLIYVNRQGREPRGIVPETEEAALLAQIRDKLLKLTDPDDGAPLFSQVYLGADIHDGRLAEWGPGLVIDFYDSAWNIQTSLRRGTQVEQARGRYFVANTKDFGHHGRDGIFAFAGPMFGRGTLAEPGTLMDVPATLLHLYDVPIPEDWDGRSLTELMTPGFLADHPPQTQPGDSETAVLTEDDYSAAETDQIFDHLRALGYVD